MQRYKCKACGGIISKVQFRSGGGHCGRCNMKRPSPRIKGKRLW